MSSRILSTTAFAGLLVISSAWAWAADQERARDQIQEGEPIFGSRLMTPQERAEYRSKMQTAKSAEERQKIRKEHHAQMVQRAKERGVTLPDEPPKKGMGGMKPGGGMGSGPGKEPGGGLNR